MNTPSISQLHKIWDAVADRTGWDFSRLNVKRAPVPWEYSAVVRDLLGGTEKVLDVGTGGDEKLVHLADAFGSARASTSTRRWSRQPARTFLSNC